MGSSLQLETRNLTKHFRARASDLVRAVHDVSFAIPAGSFTLLRGSSGSGKTTLLALLGALDRPTSGQILCEGRDLAEFSDAALARFRRRLGFVFQNFSLIAGLPVWENVTYPLIPRGISSRTRIDVARKQLEALGLADKLWARPNELSGGEQQRVALARALAAEPEMIIADEPMSNLDPDNSTFVLEILKAFHSSGKTVILAAHDSALVSLATGVIELKHGRLVT